MNTMDMLFKQVNQSLPKQSSNATNQMSIQQSEGFKQTLAKTSQQPLMNDQRALPQKMTRNESGLTIRAVVQQLTQQSEGNGIASLLPNAETTGELTEILAQLKGNQDLLALVNAEDTNELTAADVEAMLSKLGKLSDEIKTLLNELGIKLDQDIDFEQLSEQDLAQLSALVQLQPVLDQVTPLLKELNAGALENKDWMTLLQEFQALPKDLSQTLSSKLLSEDNQMLLKEMMTKFQSRMALSEKGYATHSKVTTDDISKWLAQALERQSGKTQPTFGEVFASSKGAQPLEQLTIHLSQSASTNQQTLNQELMDQFEAVLQKMQVGKNLLGQQQIKLQLNPNNLGQITVEMMEIDGEMFVKLIASSDMAKEALEANMKELRHMFSPHQVIVEQEEQATVVNGSELIDYQEQDEQTNNQDEQVSYTEDDEETELSFSDILSQEGV
jgi:flagellar hook-length control protein FliK